MSRSPLSRGQLNSSKKVTLIFVTENEFSTSTEESLICVNRLSSSAEETLNNNFKDETLSDSSKNMTIARDFLDLMIVLYQNITFWDLDAPESELFKNFFFIFVTFKFASQREFDFSSVDNKIKSLTHLITVDLENLNISLIE